MTEDTFEYSYTIYDTMTQNYYKDNNSRNMWFYSEISLQRGFSFLITKSFSNLEEAYMCLLSTFISLLCVLTHYVSAVI